MLADVILSVLLAAFALLGSLCVGFGKLIPITRRLLVAWLSSSVLVYAFAMVTGTYSTRAALVTAAVVLVVVGYLARRVSWMGRQIERLRDPRTRTVAHHLILARVAERISSGSVVLWASEIISASTAMINTSFPKDAVEMLEKMPLERLTPVSRRLVAHNLAFARLHVGDVAGARVALVLLFDLEPKMADEPRLQLLDALILVHEHHCVEALAILDRHLEAGLSQDLETTAEHARAQARAGVGDFEGAEASLRRVTDVVGTAWLKRVAETPGPAREVAARMMASTGSAYR